ncbi:Aromatic amino acid aminotransferase C56E4.03 [Daldinia childiae]|uniref:Aromatic amino acid aminotransferase C56E4.03 n=1 Tax=Daldinia childiae TaxID=326645 RepID=UPI0014482E1A|nr:Aromatic amino acid aminotransferase C56E4.03 [Daldinia childiae]KAF3055844.1 Aromatic amino acid aminotransferase C56E4.03 [Daldinia childiae]
MARLSCNPYRTLSSSSLLLVRSTRRFVPASRKYLFSTNSQHRRYSNIASEMLVEKDPVAGQQAHDRLTIDGIKERRARAGKLYAPTASYSDSDMFKSPQAPDKPKAKRWDHRLSQESIAREACVLKLAAKHLKKPGLISLGGGLPSAENFPIDSLSMHVPTPPHFTEAETALSGQDVRIGKYDVAKDENGGVYDLSIAMNYGQAIGSAQLLRWVTEHTELVHRDLPYSDWRCALTIGSTGALEQALRMFCDRARGDSILTEEYSFSTALETTAPLGIKVFGVRLDGQGLLPESMDEILSSWDEKSRGARKPTLLYTVPSGQNPTGATQSEQRRRDIYAVCQKHDVYILEDEPYYFLQMQPYTGPNTPAVPAPATVDEFLDNLVPSLLSMDVDGRVMRLDSFSKVVVPGSRVGWITASEQIVERYIRHAECCSQGPSGIAQILMYKLVDETWGHEGYLRWLMHMRLEYTRRRDTILAACEKHLPRDIVSWVPPAAGMFLWLQVDHTQHPQATTKSILEIEEEIFNSCIDKGVLAIRGSWFRAERDQPPSGLFFRTTFAAASEAAMDAAIERFGAAVRESFSTTTTNGH